MHFRPQSDQLDFHQWPTLLSRAHRQALSVELLGIGFGLSTGTKESAHSAMLRLQASLSAG